MGALQTWLRTYNSSNYGSIQHLPLGYRKLFFHKLTSSTSNGTSNGTSPHHKVTHRSTYHKGDLPFLEIYTFGDTETEWRDPWLDSFSVSQTFSGRKGLYYNVEHYARDESTLYVTFGGHDYTWIENKGNGNKNKRYDLIRKSKDLRKPMAKIRWKGSMPFLKLNEDKDWSKDMINRVIVEASFKIPGIIM